MQDLDAAVAINPYSVGNSVQELQDALSRGSPSLHRLAYKFLGNTADAEDAVQDAVFAAYKHLDNFRGHSQMSTWLHAIVANCARMQLRKRRSHVHVSLDSQLEGDQESSFADLMVDERSSPEEECQVAEANTRLNEFVSQLPPTLQKTFQLHHSHDLSICEIASILEVPTGTVKARLARARAKLSRSMQRVLQPHTRTRYRRRCAS